MKYMNTQIQKVQKTLSRINSKIARYSQIPERHYSQVAERQTSENSKKEAIIMYQASS